MRSSTGTCTSEDLLNFLDEGKDRAFLEALKIFDTSNPDWFRFQLLGISILLDLKSISEAEALSESFCHSLVDASERKLARAHYLLIAWSQGGRSAKDLDELEALLDTKVEELKLTTAWSHLRLRTEASKLMLGLSCASQKTALVRDYDEHVTKYLEEKKVAEAFYCLLELVSFISARPCPDLEIAIDTLNHFIASAAFHQPYRKRKLRTLKSIITTEQKLSRGQTLSFQDIKSEVDEAYKEIRHGSDYYDTLLKIGSLLLRYGNPEGKRIIVKSIRHYQSRGEFQFILAPINSLLAWYEETGNHMELGSIKELKSIALSKVPRPSVGKVSQNRDRGLILQMAVFQAEGLIMSNHLPGTGQIINETFTRADFLENSQLFTQAKSVKIRYEMLTGKSTDLVEVLNVAGRFCELGYPCDALDHLSNIILASIEHSQKALAYQGLEACMAFVDKNFGDKNMADLHLASVLGNFYETLGLYHLQRGKLFESRVKLEAAQALYKKHLLRPKRALNLLYQAQVIRLLYKQSNNGFDASKGLEILQEATALFRLMKFKDGVRQATLDEAHFQLRLSNFTPLDSHSVITTHVVKVHGIHSDLARTQLGKGSFYRAFTEIVESRIAGISFFHSQSLNLN